MGSAGMLGLSLPAILAAEAKAATKGETGKAKAKGVILSARGRTRDHRHVG